MEKKNKILEKLQSRVIQNRGIPERELIDIEKRKMPVIMVSDDNSGLRYDWWKDEEFMETLDPEGANLSELNTFFKDHSRSTDTAIGKIENARVENGQVKADVIFGSDDESQKIFNKYVEGILTDVSIGYSINDMVTTEKEGERTEVLVTDYTIMELSAVWKGFDKKAKVGRSVEVKKRKNKLKKKYRLLKLSHKTGSQL